MKKYYVIIGMLIALICGTVIYGISTPKNTVEFTFNDHIEETSEYAYSLINFAVENFDELNSIEVGY